MNKNPASEKWTLNAYDLSGTLFATVEGYENGRPTKDNVIFDQKYDLQICCYIFGGGSVQRCMSA
jgi:hypothetical protein